MQNIKYFFIITILICCCASCVNPSEDNSKIIKIALRDVGDKLLLSNKDSISLVKPLIAVDKNTYQLTFEKPLFISPDSLVRIVKSSFKKANLSQHYITEVLECRQDKVAYSYEMKFDNEESLVSCSGRQLKKACYTIQFNFLKPVSRWYSFVKYTIPIVVLMFAFLIYRRNSRKEENSKNENFKNIGSFKFYSEQNKLIKEAVEISLSKKECELLNIFVDQPNEIIKREELTKRVWEDNGVVVGRSLDTYVSKLRKKLQQDKNIKLTNVHGVGYKLEIKV